MRHRPENTELGWKLAKGVVVLAVLGALAGLTVLSHLVSNTNAARISCLANQRATFEAPVFFQADHAGDTPRTLQDLTGPE